MNQYDYIEKPKIIQSNEQLKDHCSGCVLNETKGVFCGIQTLLHEFVVDWKIPQMFECPCENCLIKPACRSNCVDFENYEKELENKEEYYYETRREKRRQNINDG